MIFHTYHTPKIKKCQEKGGGKLLARRRRFEATNSDNGWLLKGSLGMAIPPPSPPLVPAPTMRCSRKAAASYRENPEP
jgi:hypothetical protein